MPNRTEPLEEIAAKISDFNAADNSTCVLLKANLATMLVKVTEALTAAHFPPEGETPDLGVCS